jgi:hypothetical protein
MSSYLFLIADATEDTDCLKSAAVPIIDNQECQDMYDESHRSIIKGKQHISEEKIRFGTAPESEI